MLSTPTLSKSQDLGKTELKGSNLRNSLTWNAGVVWKIKLKNAREFSNPLRLS